MSWRPLSKRGQPDQRLDEPTEGFPEYLYKPIFEWVDNRYRDSATGRYRSFALQALQLRFKLDPPLNWRGEGPAIEDLKQRMATDEEFGLDVLDYMLHHLGGFTDQYENASDVAAILGGILILGGSAWEVINHEGEYGLARRAVGPVREAIDQLAPNTRAHRHLVSGWNLLAGRNPDPSGAYREGIRAVEAVAKPVVLPSNDRATLGTMIAAMRDKPEKWEATLGTVDEVRAMMELVWTNQLDRHGTDDESVPLKVSQAEADAAFHVCLTLVRLFAGGHVRSA